MHLQLHRADELMAANCIPLSGKLARFLGAILWNLRYTRQGKRIDFVMEVDPKDPFDQKFLSRTFNLELVIALRQLLRSGDVVVDAGAQKGYVTLHAASLVGPNGRVIAFEPDFRSRAVLSRNCSLNHVSNVKIYDFALGDGNSIRSIKLSSQLGWSSFYPNERNRHTTVNEQLVTVTRMDEVLAMEVDCEPGKLSFVKIDCEGAEPEVLRGMEMLFSKVSPLLWIEINTGSLAAAGSSEDELLTHLWRLGYRAFLPRVESDRVGIPRLVVTQYKGNRADSSHRVFDVFAARDVHLGRLISGGIKIELPL
jgi:FkbM family methyltransferase